MEHLSESENQFDLGDSNITKPSPMPYHMDNSSVISNNNNNINNIHESSTNTFKYATGTKPSQKIGNDTGSEYPLSLNESIDNEQKNFKKRASIKTVSTNTTTFNNDDLDNKQKHGYPSSQSKATYLNQDMQVIKEHAMNEVDMSNFNIPESYEYDDDNSNIKKQNSNDIHSQFSFGHQPNLSVATSVTTTYNDSNIKIIKTDIEEKKLMNEQDYEYAP
eukprot:CAMPEP_0114662036 /NCGR_PEP_ID=MMETSP0191-20121206/23957_1 /TAXON_ID=126664 /ORGANISM="Sorites sp." /LENGTH=218 /DNA_ID=CAMNT_0001896879 /DNA_START=1233 /DNA_END=1885 /DNA_ORIENTATION=-